MIEAFFLAASSTAGSEAAKAVINSIPWSRLSPLQEAKADGSAKMWDGHIRHPDVGYVQAMNRVQSADLGDQGQALTLLRQAAEQGHDKAALVLGVRHSTGQGMALDNSAAYVWAKRAEATARSVEIRDNAAKLRAQIVMRLDVKQIAAAEQKFADWVLQRELAGFSRVEPAGYKNLIVAQGSEAAAPKASRGKKTAPHKAAKAAQGERKSPKHRRVHAGSNGRRSVSYRGSGVTVRITLD